MNQIVSSSIFQLLTQFPTLLVLCGGIVVFLVMRGRSATACILSAVSFALLLLGRIAHVFLNNGLIVERAEKGWTIDYMAKLMGVTSFFFGLLEAAAFGMLIAAVLLVTTERGAPDA